MLWHWSVVSANFYPMPYMANSCLHEAVCEMQAITENNYAITIGGSVSGGLEVDGDRPPGGRLCVAMSFCHSDMF